MLQSLSDRHQQEQREADIEEVIVDDAKLERSIQDRKTGSERTNQISTTRDDNKHQLDSGSEQQSDDFNSSNRPKRNPYCSRCRNHGKSAQVKGHKRHCEYRDCQCEGCKLVECRQIVSAAQIKRRRYQKQDEECGRRIEISPPVLTREPSNDPATLIAKTLIGSAGAKHFQQQAQAQHHRGIHSAAAAANLAAAAVAAATTSSSQTSSLHHQPLNQTATSHYQHQGAQPLLAPQTVSHQLNSAAGNLHGGHPLNQLNQLAMGQHESQQSGSSSSSAAAAAAASSALSNAFHLFRFPNSVLSAMNPQASGLQQASSRANQATSSAAIPSAHEQIGLVEDIYHAFGPLAIYAWLRSEQFDLQKVRESIEVAHSPYNNLMELKSKYRGIGNHHNPNPIGNHQTSSTNSDELPSSAADHCRTLASCNHNQASSKTNYASKATSVNTTTTTNNGHQCSPLIASSSNDLTASLHSTPSYTLGCSFPGHAGDSVGVVPTSVNHQHHHSGMSLVNTFTSLPMTTAQSLLWPELKLATSGASSNVLHSAHHLLPHFMHHHPFMAHHQQHPQQTNDQKQNQHQQVSPTNSSLTNSSCSESSSSANAL